MHTIQGAAPWVRYSCIKKSDESESRSRGGSTSSGIQLHLCINIDGSCEITRLHGHSLRNPIPSEGHKTILKRIH